MKHTLSTRGLLPLGLIISLAVTLTGFEYMSSDTKITSKRLAKADPMDPEVIYDPVIQKPEVPNENQPEQNRQNTNANTNQQQVTTNVQTTQNQQQVTTTIGLPPSDTTIIIQDIFNPGKIITNEIFDVVEDMPTYEALLTIKDKDKRKSETEKELLENIYKKVKYPELARQTGIQGKVYVQFIVNTKGEITETKVLRSVHPDLDAEALRAVKSLPKMVPGKQRNVEVNVRYTIPIEFKLKN